MCDFGILISLGSLLGARHNFWINGLGRDAGVANDLSVITSANVFHGLPVIILSAKDKRENWDKDNWG